MYLCYVDESGDPGPNGSKFLILTGAALFEGKWQHLQRDLLLLGQKYWPGDDSKKEFHLNELRSGKGIFRVLSEVQRQNLQNDLCNLVNSLYAAELRAFTVIADKQLWFSQNPGKSGDDLYLELFENLSGRFDLFLRRRHSDGFPTKGIIIADPHKKQLSKAIQARHHFAQQFGNRWASIHNLIETIFFLDSRDSPGLQIADLLSYSVWRLVASNDSTLASKIYDCFDREPLASSKNAGKWHGVKYLGDDLDIEERISLIWKLPNW